MSIESSNNSGASDVPASKRDLVFAGGIVFILAILFLPIPTFLIDIGLALSIALSIIILMVALWIERPLDFSSFPTILLVATMLRLSMNIATTRSILADGHEGINAAGYVIGGFSRFVMGGDFVIGLTVFLILVVVNFVVITKGSTRIAEVGARFTLDAIPGKQMSIDADLSAGIIDDRQAQKRRAELEEESSFFGSMDGASKFVRGDAVAGLIITAINIVGGIIIGTTRHNMELAEAADVFTQLSVGDGLVSQIPALIISLAAGLLVSKGGTRGSADQAVFGQLGAHPRALQVVGVLLTCLALAPGLPMLPFLSLAAASFFFSVVVKRNQEEEKQTVKMETMMAEENVLLEQKNSVAQSLARADIELVFGHQLSSHLLNQRDDIAQRMTKMRRKFAQHYGFVVPDVALEEDLSLPPKAYRIRIHGTVAAGHELRLGEVLALVGDGAMPSLPGVETVEPAFGIRALSVPEGFEGEVEALGLPAADNVSVILTHLSEVVGNNLAQLLSYKDTRTLFDSLAPEYRKLADELCSTHISYPGLQAVLRLLLAERVSIRNLTLVLEAVSEIAPHIQRPERIVEHVRMRIAQQLCGDLAEDGRLSVVRLGPAYESAFLKACKQNAAGEVMDFDMAPANLEAFGREADAVLQTHVDAGTRFAVVTPPAVRSYVRMILERLQPNVAVLSNLEIARGFDISVIAELSGAVPVAPAPPPEAATNAMPEPAV
ncbi:flagellar biosynthesis protein FlhA [Ahrensia sp. R2A130]|uniref:flagellar biosynthesis protein FlhA n=1 Tax=Ahrensia sp. R2A130 TaxID=744979 RepID=UPI0001E0F865|nr:flagellar biosynthesis protein FlhA [Ahrensia sp. R2A130]EFL89476.1 flagellar biosynthesis protein FlhA [Ahrensia sp. R2A130]